MYFSKYQALLMLILFSCTFYVYYCAIYLFFIFVIDSDLLYSLRVP